MANRPDATDIIVTWDVATAAPSTRVGAISTGPLPDPAGKSIEDVRLIRDEIDRHVRGLVDELAS
jgi:protein-tyrosine-phosphatase